VSDGIRQLHRWVSVAFTLAVVVTSVAMSQEKAPPWVSFLPLPPLGVLQLTGMYLFVLPYVIRWRRGRADPPAAQAR
jgi:hypothetical protein